MELHFLNTRKSKVVLLDDNMRIVKPVYDFLKFQQQKSNSNYKSPWKWQPTMSKKGASS